MSLSGGILNNSNFNWKIENVIFPAFNRGNVIFVTFGTKHSLNGPVQMPPHYNFTVEYTTSGGYASGVFKLTDHNGRWCFFYYISHLFASSPEIIKYNKNGPIACNEPYNGFLSIFGDEMIAPFGYDASVHF